MEIFGHAFSGVLLSQLLEKRTAPARPAWWWPVLGAVSTTFPDVDAVTILFGFDAFKQHHQTYTHNVIAFVLAPPAIAALVHRRWPARASFPRVLALFWLGMTLHLIGDVIAQWPLRFLLPFRQDGWSFQLIPRDFSIGLALILMFGALLGYVDSIAPFRRFIAAATLVVAVLYVTVGPGV